MRPGRRTRTSRTPASPCWPGSSTSPRRPSRAAMERSPRAGTTRGARSTARTTAPGCGLTARSPVAADGIASRLCLADEAEAVLLEPARAIARCQEMEPVDHVVMAADERAVDPGSLDDVELECALEELTPRAVVD